MKSIRNFWAFCIGHKVFQKGIVLLMSFVYPYICNFCVVRANPFLSWIAFLCLLILSFWVLYFIMNSKFNFYNDNFCYYTVTSRLPSIYKKYTNKDWDVNEPIITGLWGENKLCILPNNPQDVQGVQDVSDPLESIYDKLVEERLSKYDNFKEGVRNVDFLTVEHYFYYVLYSKFRSQQPNQELCPAHFDPYHFDPYHQTKMDALEDALKPDVKTPKDKRSLIQKSIDLYWNCCGNSNLTTLLLHCVMTNTSDLSQEGAHANLVERANIKPKESSEVVNYLDELIAKRGRRIKEGGFNIKRERGANIKVDILTDNCGLELLSDIELAVYMLKKKRADSVVFHVRVLPQYVSDVTKNEKVDDFEQLLRKLKAKKKMKDENGNPLFDDHDLLFYVRKYQHNNMLRIETNLFWNLPTYYYKYRKQFSKIIGKSDLVIVKGDLNYRKLVGDKNYHSCCWFRRRVRKLGYPVLALRAIKSSLVDVGILPENLKRHNEIMHNINGLNGDYGMIRFYNGSLTRLQRIRSGVAKFFKDIKKLWSDEL